MTASPRIAVALGLLLAAPAALAHDAGTSGGATGILPLFGTAMTTLAFWNCWYSFFPTRRLGNFRDRV